MRIENSREAFLAHLNNLDLPIGTLAPAQGVDSMIAFYRDERVIECELNTDADMLLFEWGTHDWGDGENFEFSITRQFIHADGDDDCVWQLTLGFQFTPTAELTQLKSGNKWCGSLNALSHFDKFIRESAAYRTISGNVPRNVQLDLEVAG